MVSPFPVMLLFEQPEGLQKVIILTKPPEQLVNMWDGFVWLIPGCGYLSSSALSCWEQGTILD